MGEFSYTQADDLSGGYADYNSGYDSFGGYQDEVSALVPENVPMLAAILLEHGVIDNDGVNTALSRQAESGDTLVQVLLDAGLAAPDQLVMALQTRANYR
jgi:hypothetical protein